MSHQLYVTLTKKSPTEQTVVVGPFYAWAPAAKVAASFAGQGGVAKVLKVEHPRVLGLS